MNTQRIQEQFDEVTDGIGVRLIRDGGSSLYSRIFAVRESHLGVLIVAYPLDTLFGRPWSGPITSVRSEYGCLVLQQAAGEDIIVCPIGSVSDDLIELGKSSNFTIADAQATILTQWSDLV
jgi:hypothetical protein